MRASAEMAKLRVKSLGEEFVYSVLRYKSRPVVHPLLEGVIHSFLDCDSLSFLVKDSLLPEHRHIISHSARPSLRPTLYLPCLSPASSSPSSSQLRPSSAAGSEVRVRQHRQHNEDVCQSARNRVLLFSLSAFDETVNPMIQCLTRISIFRRGGTRV